MMHHRVLVVEDEDAIRELVTFHLKRAEFAVRGVATGANAVAEIGVWRPEVVVLDLLLPDVSGLDICRQIYDRGVDLGWPGVIVLTALGGESDRVAGLETGADDYVMKPFSPRELVARVRAVLRRRRLAEPGDKVAGSTPRRVGDLVINPEYLHVEVGERRVEGLTATEFRLLMALAEAAGRVLSREQLIDRVWGPCFSGDARTVDAHIRHLRVKLAQVGPADVIKTVRGFGYRMGAAPQLHQA